MNAGMSTSQLISYMRKVRDLEASCYQQKTIINGLNSRLKQAENKRIKEERATKGSSPAKPKLKFSVAIPIACMLKGALVGLMIMFPIVSLLLEEYEEAFEIRATVDTRMTVVVVTLAVSAIAGLLIGLPISKSHAKKEYASELEKYNQSLRELDCRRQSSLQAIEGLDRCIPALKSKINESSARLRETQGILAQAYGLDIIYPKYRSLVAVCTILEYLESGICSALEGANGAYNLYENELRMNLIIGKLDDIIRRLDDIADNQRMLADVIRESTRKTNSILNSMQNTLSSIEQNTAYSQYYNGVTAANTSYMAWLSAYNTARSGG